MGCADKIIVTVYREYSRQVGTESRHTQTIVCKTHQYATVGGLPHIAMMRLYTKGRSADFPCFAFVAIAMKEKRPDKILGGIASVVLEVGGNIVIDRVK